MIKPGPAGASRQVQAARCRLPGTERTEGQVVTPSPEGRRGCRFVCVLPLLTSSYRGDYCNYVKTKLVRIGNSRGVRIPQHLLRIYGLQEGAELEIEERREGLLLLVGARKPDFLPWAEAYREMAAESADAAEWADWDAASGDGDAD